MHWFIANAPIRKKLLVSFGSMVGLVGLTPLTLLLMPRLALAAGGRAPGPDRGPHA